jgi:hypothetical protein
MSSDKKGQPAPYIPVSVYQPGAISISEARRVSMAFALGDYRPDADIPYRKPHRGMLPDVDLSLAVHVPRRSILSRISQAFSRRSQDPIPAAEAASAPDEPARARPASNDRHQKYRHKPASRAA